jgi:hypothetical protein
VIGEFEGVAGEVHDDLPQAAGIASQAPGYGVVDRADQLEPLP